MKVLKPLTKPIPHRILIYSTAALTALSVLGVGLLIYAKHYSAYKSSAASGNAATYLTSVFSDPLILLALGLSVLLFVFDLAVSIRAIKQEEIGSVPRTCLLLLNVIIFAALVKRILFP